MVKQDKTRFPRGEYRKNWDMPHRDPNREYIRGKQKQQAAKYIENELFDIDDEEEEDNEVPVVEAEDEEEESNY